MDRYSFIVSDLRRLLVAGLPAHCERFCTSSSNFLNYRPQPARFTRQSLVRLVSCSVSQTSCEIDRRYCSPFCARLYTCRNPWFNYDSLQPYKLCLGRSKTIGLTLKIPVQVSTGQECGSWHSAERLKDDS